MMKASRIIWKKWRNIVILIMFAATMIAASIAPAQADVPTISNLNNAAIAEQIKTIIDSDVSISNPDSTGFGDGYIEFSLADSGSNDDLNIRSSGSPNSEGEISVSGSDVYIGTGSDKTKIGTIDATYDGQDGQKLRIDFVAETASLPTNNDFETGNTNGWTIDNSVSSVLDTPELRAVMFQTLDGDPDDDGGYDFDNTGDTGLTQTPVVDTGDVSQGTYSLKLENSGTTNLGYGYIWGPSATSSSFSANAGSKILFDWMATQTSDYYVAYALLVDNQNSVTTVLFADQGASSIWQTKEVVVSQSSNNLQFKFILGSYDNSGGKAVGATMRIDNIRAQLVTDSAATSLSQSVAYNYTDDSPSGNVISGRTLTINAQDKDSESASSTATISVYGDFPSFNSGSSFSVDENETDQTKILYDAQADNGDGGSNDQDITYSFSSGDGQNLFNIDSDDGEIRLNSVGVETLDYETCASYTLQIQADDGQAVNNTVNKMVTVNVNDVNEAPDAPIAPECEGQTNPTVISDFTPEFSWTFSDPDSGNSQSAYQIIVGTTQGSSDMWNSNKVTSSSSGEISYSGSALSPGTTYHWKVKTWDNLDLAGSYCADQTFITIGPTLTLGSIGSITSDWGRDFDLNHSVTVTNANANNVKVSYNVSWIPGNTTFGAVAEDETRWHNQSISNSTVQNITVKVDATTTSTSAINDTATFRLNLTRRDITITTNPGLTQSVGVDETFWINTSAKDEYEDMLICKADLIRGGSIIETKDISSGNANFSRTEPLAGTFNFSVRFYNTTHYNNESTSNSSVTINGPGLTLGNLNEITSDWGRSFSLNHSVTVTDANANNVNVTYNVSWIPDNSTMGTIAKDGTKWHNQSITNSTVQEIKVKVDATSTSGFVINDSKTFQVNITRRNIEITSAPKSTQSIILDQTFQINASVSDEHEDNLICKADLIREGSVIENQTITNGNAHFSTTEPAPGTFNFSIIFYNTTHYNNATTSNCTVSVVDITPPIITNITNTTPTSDSVTITWNTDENSNSLVRYGTVKGTYDFVKSSATMVTSHTVTLTELNHNTVYYFVVNSTDNSNNSNESAEYNFTTKCTYGTISGLVTDSSTGHPIHNATVSTGGMTIYTWTDGTYTIQSIAPGTYTLNVSASGYLWNNSTVVAVSSGLISRANVTLTPEKVKLALHNSETTSIKSAPNGTQVIFELSATNYGTKTTFTITNSSDATIVTGCSSFILNSSESKGFNITATNQTAGYYPIKITVSNSSLSKSASVTFYAVMQNMSANYTTKGSCTVNTTNKASVTGNSMLVNSTVDTGANVNDSTLVHANVTGGANVTGESLVQYSNITGSGSVVGNGSVVEYSTVDNSTMAKGVISRNSTVVDSALDNTTLTDSGFYGKTTITDSTVVNVTANKSTIIGVEIDTGYSITLTNVTVKASAKSGKGGRPEIQGGTNAIVMTRGVNFTNIYTDVLIEDLVLQYIGNKTSQKNTSMTINASNTVKCDLTVNMTEPASINITETGINPDGEGTESILSEDTLKWVPVGSFIYIQHNASGEGNFTIRRYYDPSLNYTEVYIYYYNTTSNLNVWERKNTTANGTKGGLKWIEAVVNHLSTFVLMGTLEDDSGSTTVSSSSSRGSSNGPYITSTPTVLATEVQTTVPMSGDDDTAAPTRTETENDEAFGHGVDTGTDEIPPAQTGNKGLLIFGLVGVIVGVIIIVLVIRRKNECENE